MGRFRNHTWPRLMACSWLCGSRAHSRRSTVAADASSGASSKACANSMRRLRSMRATTCSRRPAPLATSTRLSPHLPHHCLSDWHAESTRPATSHAGLACVDVSCTPSDGDGVGRRRHARYGPPSPRRPLAALPDEPAGLRPGARSVGRGRRSCGPTRTSVPPLRPHPSRSTALTPFMHS